MAGMFDGAIFDGPDMFDTGDAVTPLPSPGGGVDVLRRAPRVTPAYDRPTQRAKLHPFEQPDQYGILVATQGQAPTRRAAVRALLDDDLYTPMQAASVYRASMGARNLPSRDVLMLFLNELS